MNHVQMLDDRHANLLSLIVLAWLAWGYAAMRMEREGGGWIVVSAAVLAAVVMQVSAGLGLFATQWVIAAVVGTLIGRDRRR